MSHHIQQIRCYALRQARDHFGTEIYTLGYHATLDSVMTALDNCAQNGAEVLRELDPDEDAIESALRSTLTYAVTTTIEIHDLNRSAE